MRRAGAPAPAVAFARLTDSQGYLSTFRDSGRVDVGWAVYPFRANENRVCFLLNGEPPAIDVDEPSRIRAALSGSVSYAAMAGTHGDVTVFPGDRFHSRAIVDRPRPSGGQRFLVPYVLREGCHACATLGNLILAFDFDAAGRFVGASVASVEAARA